MERYFIARNDTITAHQDHYHLLDANESIRPTDLVKRYMLKAQNWSLYLGHDTERIIVTHNKLISCLGIRLFLGLGQKSQPTHFAFYISREIPLFTEL